MGRVARALPADGTGWDPGLQYHPRMWPWVHRSNSTCSVSGSFAVGRLQYQQQQQYHAAGACTCWSPPHPLPVLSAPLPCGCAVVLKPCAGRLNTCATKSVTSTTQHTSAAAAATQQWACPSHLPSATACSAAPLLLGASWRAWQQQQEDPWVPWQVCVLTCSDCSALKPLLQGQAALRNCAACSAAVSACAVCLGAVCARNNTTPLTTDVARPGGP